MKASGILKTLLPGLLPLLVFIAADEIWGTEIGLYVAVAFGVVQVIVIYIKEKRLDKFVLYDTLLIIMLGLISILLHNDIFFKIKPGIIGLILVGILGLSAFSGKNVMMMMTQRYIKGMKMNEAQQIAMKRSIKLMFWLFLFHTILVFYSAFMMSKEAWAFISGVLFYLIFGVYMLYEFVRNFILRRKSKTEEYLAEVDKDGKVIGKISRTEAHSGTMKLHPVVHAHFFNLNGDILLQKRSMNKNIQPGKWDTAVGGHISFGEIIEDALVRETQEELGIQDIKFEFITKYFWQSDIESELIFVFIAFINDIYFIPNNEVDEVKFWSKVKIEKSIGINTLTPNFEQEYNRILKKIKINKKSNL
jgi:isopentenyldiphosphate isomerase